MNLPAVLLPIIDAFEEAPKIIKLTDIVKYHERVHPLPNVICACVDKCVCILVRSEFVVTSVDGCDYIIKGGCDKILIDGNHPNFDVVGYAF